MKFLRTAGGYALVSLFWALFAFPFIAGALLNVR